MPRLRYSVAASLDGFIAGPHGEYDWIPMDPDIDFSAMYAGVSRLVMGRESYDVYKATGGGVEGLTLPICVYSRSLPEGDHDGVTFVRDAVPHVRALKAGTAEKPIWLWGGGTLFRSLAEAGLVDGVEVAIVPILLGGGVPLFPPPAPRLPLRLTSQRLYEKSGILFCTYDVRE